MTALRAKLPSSSPARAEALAATWELLSALLFASSVVPEALESPIPPLLFVGSLVLSASFSPFLSARAALGALVAGALRALAWPLTLVAPLDFASAPGSAEAPSALVAAATFGVMAGAVRASVYRRARGGPAPTTPASIRRELGESASIVGIVGGHVLLLFSVAFLRTRSQVVLRAWFELVPWLALLGTIGFSLALRPLTSRLGRVLGPSPGAEGRRARELRTDIERAVDEARALPSRLALTNFFLWLLCTSIGVFYVRPGPSTWNPGDAVMQLAACALFAAGVSLYQRALHRDTVAPILEALRRRLPRGAAKRVGRGGEDEALPVRRRMMRDFGVPLLFLAAISLLSTIALRRAISAELGSVEDDGALSSLFVAFAVIAVAVFVGVARAASDLARPMTDLAEAADRVARGELGRPVPALGGPAELRGVGRSVERMREALASTIAELERERALLERRVEERTAELSGALEALKRTQAALIQQERMASVGELVAGVAHEIYNPLTAIAGASAPLGQLASDLGALLEAYRAAEARLPPEGRAELERLRAEVDPEGALDDLRGIERVVRRAVDRSVAIVQNLKSFSRAPGEAVPADLHAGIDETLVLLGPRLRQAGVEVERRFGELPEVVCRAGEINQVFMNLFTNALQALAGSPGPRRIRVETHAEGDEVVVEVSDSGPGVPEEIRARVFDPFFTTKARGEGTGLGLSISAEIARRHGGSLSLATRPAKGDDEARGEAPGAEFVLRLPRSAPASRAERAAPESPRLRPRADEEPG